MSQTATERLRLQPAPDGLALVQDLLNTRDIGGKVPDLLADVDQARDWLSGLFAVRADTELGGWARELSERDLAALRVLRGAVQVAVGGSDPTSNPGTLTKVDLSWQPSGELRLEPTGSGRRRFASAVWGAVFLAQQAKTWNRLKLCHLPACSSAFYDRSKNNSGVWHDVRMCGNAANLRASRARRRDHGAVTS